MLIDHLPHSGGLSKVDDDDSWPHGESSEWKEEVGHMVQF